jgi:Zinc-binding loop region of homing endonuclease
MEHPRPQSEQPTDANVNRFNKYVEKQSDTDCWIWKGGKDVKSYGVFFFNGRPQFAHRVSLILFKKIKQFTPGLQVLHSCKNRDCVNPDHLREGTAVENAADRKRDQTDLSGERCHFAKLTWAKVEDIRKKALDGTKAKQLSKDYGVSITTIRSIVKNITWVK